MSFNVDLRRALRAGVRAGLAETAFEIRRRPPGSAPGTTFCDFDNGNEIAEVAARFRPRTMVSDSGLAVLYQQVRHLDKTSVSGALVECGVWHGGSAAVLAAAHQKAAVPKRDIHLFDSWEGIPEPDADIDGLRAVRDVGGPNQAHGRLRVAWDYAERGGPGEPDAVAALIASAPYPEEKIHLHQGWFQDTVPSAASSIGPIALLHLDGDWYESTKVCLENLYGHVSERGIVMVNDYGAYDGCRLAVDEFLAGLGSRPFLSHVDKDVRYWIKAT